MMKKHHKVTSENFSELSRIFCPTTETAKYIFDKLKEGESIMFDFTDPNPVARQIFKKTDGRLISGQVRNHGEKAGWLEGFGPEDWKA